MKFLLDANLSPRVAEALKTGDTDCIHVADVGLATASDEVTFDYAADNDFVIITADSDFPMLLALRNVSAPSVVHLRRTSELSPDEHAALLVANLPTVMEDLADGAIVSLSHGRMRVRSLPISPA